MVHHGQRYLRRTRAESRATGSNLRRTHSRDRCHDNQQGVRLGIELLHRRVTMAVPLVLNAQPVKRVLEMAEGALAFDRTPELFSSFRVRQCPDESLHETVFVELKLARRVNEAVADRECATQGYGGGWITYTGFHKIRTADCDLCGRTLRRWLACGHPQRFPLQKLSVSSFFSVISARQ